MRNQFQFTCAIVIGLVAQPVWRQTLFLKDLANPRRHRYLWLIGDRDSSVYHSVVKGVLSHGQDITKVECAIHAVKCYRNQLEALHNETSDYCGKHGLSSAMMKRITHGASCAIKMHSVTGDITYLRHDLRIGSQHYFVTNNYNSTFRQQKSNLSSGKHS